MQSNTEFQSLLRNLITDVQETSVLWQIAVLAASLARLPVDPGRAMRLYEGVRQARTARVQRAARSNGTIYHLGLAGGMARNLVLLMTDGSRLLSLYDLLFDWRHSTPYL